MKVFFSYIWYRITKVYRKRDEIGITGSSFLAWAQAGIIMLGLFTIRKYFLPVEFQTINQKWVGYIGASIILLFTIINHKLYSHEYDALMEKFRDEPKLQAFIKGVLIIIFLLSPLIIGVIKWK